MCLRSCAFEQESGSNFLPFPVIFYTWYRSRAKGYGVLARQEIREILISIAQNRVVKRIERSSDSATSLILGLFLDVLSLILLRERMLIFNYLIDATFRKGRY